MGHYADEVARRRAADDGFTEENLDPRLIPYYDEQGEILVRWPDGTVRTGRVGMGIGTDPVFMLMLHPWNTGSSTYLPPDAEVEILGHKPEGSDVFAPVPPAGESLPPETNPTEGVLGD